eukprot:11529731-Alexandrium_andersonii.AAC.1
MSASLVGSEMCIRDSFNRRFGRPGGSLTAPRALKGSSHVWGGLPMRPCPCLLYTSDAADDM